MQWPWAIYFLSPFLQPNWFRMCEGKNGLIPPAESPLAPWTCISYTSNIFFCSLGSFISVHEKLQGQINTFWAVLPKVFYVTKQTIKSQKVKFIFYPSHCLFCIFFLLIGEYPWAIEDNSKMFIELVTSWSHTGCNYLQFVRLTRACMGRGKATCHNKGEKKRNSLV